MAETFYRFEFDIPAEHSDVGRDGWQDRERYTGPGGMRFRSADEARAAYRTYRMAEEEWPVRLVRVTMEVVPIEDV